MGKLYESEHNRSLVRRIWSWALGTLGVGGVIAACILFPALIPLAGSLVGWLVGRAPGLAGWFGVVGKKAFDSVVTGVGKARSEFKKSEKPESLELLNTELAKATDRADRKIIDARREALNV
ncbi:MAG: hypothetical protein JWN25_1276 [Verrucomicrobiales bacterium]|nr:hypothetical protein [Verrucomicrobiales bacterium]